MVRMEPDGRSGNDVEFRNRLCGAGGPRHRSTQQDYSGSTGQERLDGVTHVTPPF